MHLRLVSLTVAILSPLTGCAMAGVASPGSGGSGGRGMESSAGVSGSASGSGDSSADSAIPATFDTVKLVLQGGGPIMPCAAAPCHGVHGMAPPGRPLELPPNNDEQLYTNLTSYISTACNSMKLVTPGNPAQSAILAILNGPCGATPRMPYMCTDLDSNCIPDEYIAAIAQWISHGAPSQ
jgi:hypothetical protein